MSLEMYPDCHECGRDLPPDSRDAWICSLECTFCTDCAENKLGGICPNCGGELRRRPTREAELLKDYPATTVRKGAA
jgi:hypothetical protein